MKKLSVILGALLLSSALLSCGDTATTTPKTTEENSPTGLETVAETEDVNKRPPVGLPDGLNFGGETFNMLTFGWQGYRYYFFADEENGDVMNDAIFARKTTVEETLNVKLTYDMQPSDSCSYVPNLVKSTVLAGDDVYQMALFHCIDGIASSSSSGYLYNLDTLPNIDITAEWWNSTQMDQLRLGMNTYYAVNDFMIPCPYVIFFNKELVAQFDMDNPYQLVYDGKWTLDAFCSMAKTVVADLNGDGKMDKENDRYGVTCNEGSKYISFMPASNQFITSRDSDGRLELSLNTEKTQNLVEIFADLAKSNVCYIASSQAVTDQLTLNTSRLMFTLGALSSAEEMRDYTVDIGMLPYPKYDEAQKTYYSMDWGGLMGVPTTIRNPEMVGAVIELLAYESGNTVVPTYYDLVLSGKLARDADAAKMLDIIFDTICYEIGGNYFGFSAGFNQLFYLLSNLSVQNKSSDFASYYKKNEKSAQKQLDSFYKQLDNYENG